ncbi:MAG: [FeFe] hydrogenase H-cluster maturation GTPase HydF [Eubacteriales bacterium]|nr:[FeFe] hydrogenase H-cluster maturation GTPase HydF [Eubacteriales bacterium]
MSLNDTPSGERIHIGFFGRRNAGKSSVVNAVTGQDLAVVSRVEGTTTDPVKKAMELLPLGPVLIIDTPGFDDEGALGELRVRKTRQVLAQTDVAVLVVDGSRGMCACDRQLLELFAEKEIPFLIAWNKCDLAEAAAAAARVRSGRTDTPESEGLSGAAAGAPDSGEPAGTVLPVSALTGEGIYTLKEQIGALYRSWKAGREAEPRLVSDLLKKGDQVILVIPIDKSAPKGRLILPQQQVIRDILDARCTAVCIQEDNVQRTLDSLRTPPALVITDSQVFASVQKDVPDDIPLTSFSILMARYKGFLKTAAPGAAAIDRLQDGDRILIAEGCTHHRQCEDIGTVKLPRWLSDRTGKQLVIETSSGNSFPEDLTPYAMVIHCGGCMLNEREMQSRIRRAVAQGVPVTNYGTAIAYMNGILKRSTAMFPDITL